MFFGRRADIFVIPMFLSLLSRQGSIRLARAFVQNPATKRVIAVGGAPIATTFGGQHRFQSELGSSVEEDLDQALSSFLDDEPLPAVKAKDLADVIPNKQQGAGMETLKLSDLLEESEVCYLF